MAFFFNRNLYNQGPARHSGDGGVGGWEKGEPRSAALRVRLYSIKQEKKVRKVYGIKCDITLYIYIDIDISLKYPRGPTTSNVDYLPCSSTSGLTPKGAPSSENESRWAYRVTVRNQDAAFLVPQALWPPWVPPLVRLMSTSLCPRARDPIPAPRGL